MPGYLLYGNLWQATWAGVLTKATVTPLRRPGPVAWAMTECDRAAGKREDSVTIRPTDLAALDLVGSPTLAPDGSAAVAAVQTIDPDSWTYRSRLWSFAADREGAALTEAGAWSDTAPRYSPDGRYVAFLSTREGGKQAYLLEIDSARLHPLGPVDGRVVAVDWLAGEGGNTVIAVVEHSQQPDDGMPVTVEWLQYKRDGETGFVEPVHELWSLGPTAGPQLLRRLPGRVCCLATGGGRIAYALDARHADVPEPPVEVRRYDPKTGTDELVWTSPSKVDDLAVTDLSGHVIAITSGMAGQSAAPPRAWLLGDDAAPLFLETDLEIERAMIGDCRPLGGSALVRSVAESDRVLFLATSGHEVALYSGELADRLPRRLTPPGLSVTDFSASRAGSVAVCVERPTEPVELYRLRGDRLDPMSTLNVKWARSAAPVAPEPVELADPDLRGLLYRSPGTGRGPLVIRVHGGPHMCFGASFDLETQILVSAGYRVLLPNPRGSAGRGSDFRAGSIGQWGDGDYQDLMAFVDWAVDSAVADPGRLYLAGGSYGGYLINWTLTRTDRFRAAISERSISNLLSKYGTADNGCTVNRSEMNGADLFDESAAWLLERSPLRHAQAVTTPLLLLHAENDYRCPIEQAEQFFVALRRLGREVRFVRFPDESHGMSLQGRPDRRLARLNLILDWLAEHGMN